MFTYHNYEPSEIFSSIDILLLFFPSFQRYVDVILVSFTHVFVGMFLFCNLLNVYVNGLDARYCSCCMNCIVAY